MREKLVKEIVDDMKMGSGLGGMTLSQYRHAFLERENLRDKKKGTVLLDQGLPHGRRDNNKKKKGDNEKVEVDRNMALYL